MMPITRRFGTGSEPDRNRYPEAVRTVRLPEGAEPDRTEPVDRAETVQAVRRDCGR